MTQKDVVLNGLMNIKFQKMREIDLTKEQKLLCVNDYKVYDVDETGKYIKEKVVFYGGKTYDYNGSYCVVDENSFYRALNGDEIRKFFIPSPEQEETKKNASINQRLGIFDDVFPID